MILTFYTNSREKELDSGLVDSHIAFMMQSLMVDDLSVCDCIYGCIRALHVPGTDKNYCVVRQYLSDNGNNDTGLFYLNNFPFRIMRRDHYVQTNKASVKDMPCVVCGDIYAVPSKKNITENVGVISMTNKTYTVFAVKTTDFQRYTLADGIAEYSVAVKIVVAAIKSGVWCGIEIKESKQ